MDTRRRPRPSGVAGVAAQVQRDAAQRKSGLQLLPMGLKAALLASVAVGAVLYQWHIVRSFMNDLYGKQTPPLLAHDEHAWSMLALVALLAFADAVCADLVDCASTERCYNTVLECAADTCTYDCAATYACTLLNVRCAASHPNCTLTVLCSGKLACTGLDMDCSSAGNCTSHCSGLYACNYHVMYTRNDTTVPRSIYCDAWGACKRQALSEPGVSYTGATCVGACREQSGLNGTSASRFSRARFVAAARYKGLLVDNGFFTAKNRMQVLSLAAQPLHEVPGVADALLFAYNEMMYGEFVEPIVVEPLSASGRVFKSDLSFLWWSEYIRQELAPRLEEKGFPLINYTLYTNNASIDVQLANNLPFPLSEALLKELIHSSVNDYVSGIFNLPNECVNVDVYTANSTHVDFLAVIHDDSDCAEPVPFWGACCIAGKWFSKDIMELEFGNLVATTSPVVHEGIMSVVTAPVVFLESSFQFISAFQFTSSNINLTRSTFTADSLTGSAGSTLVLDASSVVLSSNFSLSLDSSLTLNSGSLVTVNGSVAAEGTLVVGGLTGAAISPALELVLVRSPFEPVQIFKNVVTPGLTAEESSCLQLRYKSSLSAIVLFCDAARPNVANPLPTQPSPGSLNSPDGADSLKRTVLQLVPLVTLVLFFLF